MGKDSDQIGLKLPGRKKPGKGSFSVKSGNLEEWVEGLPVGNAGETTNETSGIPVKNVHPPNSAAVFKKDRRSVLREL